MQLRLRRVVASVHRWIGLFAGIYILLIALTGAALLFRPDMQNAMDRELLAGLDAGSLADPAIVISGLRETYPGSDIASIEMPTNRRPATLVSVQQGRRYVNLLLDPASGRVLGAQPQHALIRTLYRLHFDLTLGRTGRLVNGIGALLVTALALSGPYLWWRGRHRWREGFKVARGQPAGPTNRALHDAVGIWATLAILMWGVTGAAFVFPSQFAGVIGWFSPLEADEPPEVVDPPDDTPVLPLARQLEVAQDERPDRYVARVVLPGHPSVPTQVFFARDSPTVIGEHLDPVYVDPWRGTVIPPEVTRSTGQAVWDSLRWLHTGGFGGYGVRTLWLLLALTPVLLLVTGLVTWWLRRRGSSRMRGA